MQCMEYNHFSLPMNQQSISTCPDPLASQQINGKQYKTEVHRKIRRAPYFPVHCSSIIIIFSLVEFGQHNYRKKKSPKSECEHEREKIQSIYTKNNHYQHEHLSVTVIPILISNINKASQVYFIILSKLITRTRRNFI